MIQEITLESDRSYGLALPAHDLGAVLASLTDAVRSAVRMAFEGRSVGPGKTPRWLKAASDIRYLGHEDRGYAQLAFEAPSLGEAADRLYSQGELWNTRPDPNDTGFDILGDVITDVAVRNYDSDRFDPQLLGRVFRFKQILGDQNRPGKFRVIGFASNNRPKRNPIEITTDVAQAAKSLVSNTPMPRRARLIGVLDMVRASTNSFAIKLDDQTEARGVLLEGSTSTLSSLLGRRVLVIGDAIYRPSGKLLRVDAFSVEETIESGSLFSEVPAPKRPKFDVRDVVRRSNDKSIIASIFGRWPGDESEDEILRALKELD